MKPKIFTICPLTASIRQPVVKTSRLCHLTQIIYTRSASDSQWIPKGWDEVAARTYNPSSQGAGTSSSHPWLLTELEAKLSYMARSCLNK